MHKKISFIIITWNGLNFMKSLLQSMENLIADKDYEVIVVDNGSSDDTAEYIRNHYNEIRLIELPANKGVSFARNRGLEIADGDYLFIIDNDMLINDEAVHGMYDFMENNPDVGICGCALRYGDGELQDNCKKYPGFICKFKRLLNINKPDYTYNPEEKPFDVTYLIGACQFIRRETFEQVGSLDENIFYGPEDCDYCLRTSKKGWRVTFVPQYSLIHYCQRITRSNPFSRIGRLHIRGMIYLYWKYKRL